MAGTNEGVIYARGLFEEIVEMLTDGRNVAKKFRPFAHVEVSCRK